MNKIFTLYTRRYTIDSNALIEARKELGLSQYCVAVQCGWSASYQWRLEHGKINTVDESTKNVLESVLKEKV